MPITPFLNGERFDPEDKRVLGVAFEMVASLCGLVAITRTPPLMHTDFFGGSAAGLGSPR